LPARYAPPSGFGYPLDGLFPSIPRRFYFNPAALLGLIPSELSPPERYLGVSTSMHPPTVFSRDFVPPAVAVRPASQAAVSGLPPFPESLAALHRFNMPTAGCSLGFSLLGPVRENLDRDFAQSPLTRFLGVRLSAWDDRHSNGATEYPSALAWSCSSSRPQANGVKQNDPSRVSHPHRPAHSSALHSGY